MASASDILPPSDKKGRSREKVALKPGFHLTDWMRLTQHAHDLSGRNGGPLRNISREELAQHNTQFDCWTALNGKVYNITQYMAYHPGGEKKLMLGAGKDCTAMFNKFHAWVNGESMLAKCQVGVLSESNDAIKEEDEEDDDEEEKLDALQEQARNQLSLNSNDGSEN
mmetsp:Transcript_14865/g.22357  ORF Transcript_14865/g.22357 Transcript_14865/m.22357 type:complete len:168 (+) Transcript_14865:63-566(+)